MLTASLRRVGAAALLACLLIGCVFVSQSAATTRAQSYSQLGSWGDAAGYSLYGTATSISAEWVVPAIRSEFRGEAFTDIGLYFSTGQTLVFAGTTAQRASATNSPARYAADWTDP